MEDKKAAAKLDFTSAPSNKISAQRNSKLDKTRPSTDGSACYSMVKNQLNKTVHDVSKSNLAEEKRQSRSNRSHSVSCESNSPSFGPDISELND